MAFLNDLESMRPRIASVVTSARLAFLDGFLGPSYLKVVSCGTKPPDGSAADGREAASGCESYQVQVAHCRQHLNQRLSCQNLRLINCKVTRSGTIGREGDE